jgi:hypothetical protein
MTTDNILIPDRVKIPNLDRKRDFDAVAFFRSVKERMAKATEGMTLQEERNYWKLMREGKIKLP